MTVIVEIPSPRKLFDAGMPRWAEKAYRKLPRDAQLLPPYIDAAALHLMSRLEESALLLERIDDYVQGLPLNNGSRKVRTFVYHDMIKSYVAVRGRLVAASSNLPDWFKFFQMCIIEDGL